MFIHMGRVRKAFTPVACLSGKLRKSSYDRPEGHECFCTETSRCSLPRSIPWSSLLLLLLRAGQRHQALGKAALCVHPWCSTRGELQPWLFQHGCSFVFLSLISPLQASRALLIMSLVAPRSEWSLSEAPCWQAHPRTLCLALAAVLHCLLPSIIFLLPPCSWI